MYAPLALTFVYRNRAFIRCLTCYFLRAPVVQITANGTTPTPTPAPTPSSKRTSHTGAIAGGISGGVAALILLVGVIAFVRRRRRPDYFRKSAGSSFTGTVVEVPPQMTVTPFNPPLDGAPPEVGSQIRTTNDGTSTSEPPSPAHYTAPVPAGLSGKELALLRSAAMLSPPTVIPPGTSSSGSQPFTPQLLVPPRRVR